MTSITQILTSRKTATASRVNNTRLAKTPGEARAMFEQFLVKNKGKAEVLIGKLRFGSNSATLSSKGRVNPPVPESDEKDEGGKPIKVPFKETDLASSLGLIGSAPLNKVVHGFEVPCGVCLIIAGGGAGKTPLAWGLAAAGRSEDDQFAVCRIGEPLAGYVSDDLEAAERIMLSMFHSSDVVVDSIKDLLSSAKGAAMKSGLSRDALSVLSSWSEIACAMGVTLYVPVNPSTPDPEVMDMLSEAARSNATCTIVSAGKDNWKYFARSGEGLNRREGSFGVRYDADGWAVLSSLGGSHVKTSSTKAPTAMAAVDVSPDVWNDSMRRSIEIAINGKNS